jgi:hypothetical protein
MPRYIEDGDEEMYSVDVPYEPEQFSPSELDDDDEWDGPFTQTAFLSPSHSFPSLASPSEEEEEEEEEQDLEGQDQALPTFLDFDEMPSPPYRVFDIDDRRHPASAFGFSSQHSPRAEGSPQEEEEEEEDLIPTQLTVSSDEEDEMDE